MKNEDKLRPTPGGAKGEMSTEAYDKEMAESKRPKKLSMHENFKRGVEGAMYAEEEHRQAHAKDRGYKEHR